jgi:hypothetical protein
VLIVCEGTKTEPNYLEGLKSVYSLSSANIKIAHSGATHPRGIVEFTLEEMDKNEYDRAYCVFDTEGEQKHLDALQVIAASPEGKAKRLFAITSSPCFEVWLLLHFAYTSAPFAATGKRSAGEMVVAKLIVHIADYKKGQKGLFEVMLSRLDAAIANAKKLEKHNKESGTTNPHTKVHDLVEYLRAIKNNTKAS